MRNAEKQINFTSEEIISSSIAINKKNPNRFEQLINSVGIEETYILPHLFFKNDPRSKNNEVGDFEAQLRVALDSNEKSIKTLINGLKKFYATPDLFNFWRYALLSKFLIDLELEKDEVEIPEDWPNGWVEMVKFGVDLSSCISVLNKLNISVESEEISPDDYQGGLQTVVACYLALALNLDLEDSSTEVAKLIRMVAICDDIDGVNISTETIYGRGEHAVPCLRMLEEFTGVCIEAPDGVDFEADGYMDYVDWDSVADQIIEQLG